MALSKTLRILFYLICGFSLILHGYVALFLGEGGLDRTALWLMLWSLVPYGVCIFIAVVSRSVWPPIMGSSAALIIDIFNLYAVFIDPRHSTAALGLIFVPLWNLVVFVPLGLLVGWILDKKLTGK